MSKLREQIKTNSISHGSIPFWSWNDKLEEGELRQQIRRMHELGMNGFFMHARSGLETEYMSDEWFDCINACVDEAKKLGMEAWSYDENGWPSGFAGGELLKDQSNCAVGLEYKIEDKYPEGENVLCVYKESDGKFALAAIEDKGPYHVIYTVIDVSYVDTLNVEVTRKFIEATHEKYKEKVGFGKYMPGFFTDEPQYFRWGTPYSFLLPDEFYKAYGYELVPNIIKLFVNTEGCEEFRYDYHLLIHTLFINNFVKTVYDWCEENGCKLTGHGIEESSLNGQMLCCGGIMPFYEYEHIPGIDYLTRGISTDLSSKQLGSVCAQTGKEKAISEMFACCGWDVTPIELKRIAELQYAGGVNLMCQHLYPYSERGQRKRDYPCHYSHHLSWQDKMSIFNQHFNNLGYTLSLGKEFVNTLVIHPIHSAYLKYRRCNGGQEVCNIDGKLLALTNLLGENQIPYHFGDESMMKRLASVEGNKIRVGKCEYEYVIIPACYTLDSSTVRLLKEFLSCGGKIWMYGDKPDRIDGRVSDMSWLKPTCEFSEINYSSPLQIRHNGLNAKTVRAMIRDTKEYGKIYFVTNLGFDKLTDVEITVEEEKNIASLNMITLNEEKLREKGESGKRKILLDFSPAQSYILVPTESGCTLDYEKSEETKYLPIPQSWKLESMPENSMNLDRAEISYDGINFEKNRSIEEIRDMLLKKRFKGKIYLKHTFFNEDFNGSIKVCVEPLKYSSFKVNGEDVEFGDGWWFDKLFRTADISKYLKNGKNEVVYSFDYYQRDYVYYVLYGGVSESLRNSLAFDTEIEDIYLVGDFAVDTSNGKFEYGPRNSVSYSGEFKLKNGKREINPYDIVTDGYPFFSGNISIVSEFNYEEGMPDMLRLTGRYSCADIYLNGQLCGNMLFDNELSLKDYLKAGNNQIKIVLYNSPRNLMGPHHRPDPEPYAVAPNTFSYEHEWVDGQCRGEYLDRYAFVRFGINTDNSDNESTEFVTGHLKL